MRTSSSFFLLPVAKWIVAGVWGCAAMLPPLLLLPLPLANGRVRKLLGVVRPTLLPMRRLEIQEPATAG
jgi:hypothetical protein